MPSPIHQRDYPTGVALNAPSEKLIPDIRASIDRALATVPDGHRAACVGVMTNTGLNLAVVAKLDHGFTVDLWIGKTWGESLAGGAYVMWSR